MGIRIAKYILFRNNFKYQYFIYIWILYIDRVLDHLSPHNDILINGLDGNRLVFNSVLKYVETVHQSVLICL